MTFNGDRSDDGFGKEIISHTEALLVFAAIHASRDAESVYMVKKHSQRSLKAESKPCLLHSMKIDLLVHFTHHIQRKQGMSNWTVMNFQDLTI